MTSTVSILTINLLVAIWSSGQYLPCDIRGQTADCSSRLLPYVPQDLPFNITTLLLKDNNIELSATSFSKYGLLKHLDISSNSLIDLEDNTFHDLQYLTTLNLEDNSLALSPGVYKPLVFAGLSELQNLNIGGNSDALSSSVSLSFPDVSIGHLLSLQNLTIDGVPSNILGGGFRKLKKLNTLVFGKHCFMYYINENMFDNTPFLTILDLSDCHISDIHPYAFSRLPHIDTIDLSGNTGLGFSNATDATFGLQNTSIRVLRMNKIVLPYAISVVPPNTSLIYLQHTSIKELYLDSNNMVILAPGTFDYFPPSLQFVSVRDNRFTVGYYIFEIQKLKGLKKIDLSDMSIGYFLKRPDFVNDYGATYLNPVPLPTAPDVEEIIVTNSISHSGIPSVNFMPNNITTVDISQNGISIWKGPVFGLTKLKSVDLSMNYCDKIDLNFFKYFSSMKSFNATDNYLGVVLDEEKYSCIFCPLYNLQTLDLSKNRFRKFNRLIFQNNTSLKHLNLSDNKIEDCNFQISQLKELEILNLRGNQIRYLHRQSRIELDALQKVNNVSIDIADNPIACTCENSEFLHWILETDILFLNFNEYTCTDENNDKKRFDINFIETILMRCNSKSYLGFMLGSGAVFTFLLSLIAVGVIHRFRWKIKYLYYVARDRYSLETRHGREGRHFEYDAFISFANEDMDFVHRFVTKLEQNGKRCCVHHRDFRLGEPIGANIVKAVQRSRRTILMVTSHFLTSSWCRYEFEMARMESVYDERKVVIVIKVGHLQDASLPRELMYMMHSDSYLEWPDNTEPQEEFWFCLDRVMAEA